MAQSFGSFIKSKRKDKMIKLNAFAKQIGISNVYLSYIESGKRPAPSEKILDRIAKALMLNAEETAYFHYLASISHSKSFVSETVLKYLSERPYVYQVILLAEENQLSESAWQAIEAFIRQVICQPK